jgi:hypothetical protein
MNKTIKYSVLAVVVAAALAAPAPAATPDAWITTKTKLSLLTTEGVSGTAIYVDTILGKVTLHGKVRTAEEKAKAESIAKKIDGVRKTRRERLTGDDKSERGGGEGARRGYRERSEESL